MKSILPMLAFFLFCFVRVASDYRTHWECGRYFMPKTIVGPDRYHYPDGEPIVPTIQMLVQADIEEEVHLALACGLVATQLWWGVWIWKLHRVSREYREMFGRDFTDN